MVFLVVENENRQLEDLQQADFGRVHEKISFVGKEKVNNWEFCEKKATPIVCFCNGSTHIFILSVIADALYAFFFLDCETYISFVLGEEDSSWGLRIFLYPTLVTRRKNIFLNSSSSSKLTISTISIKGKCSLFITWLKNILSTHALDDRVS